MKKIEPIGDRILIKQKVDKETVSTSGIILAQNEEKKYPIGEIIAIGTGEKVKLFNIGEEVLFDEWGGLTVAKEFTNQEHLLILSFDKVIARLCQSNP